MDKHILQGLKFAVVLAIIAVVAGIVFNAEVWAIALVATLNSGIAFMVGWGVSKGAQDAKVPADRQWEINTFGQLIPEKFRPYIGKQPVPLTPREREWAEGVAKEIEAGMKWAAENPRKQTDLVALRQKLTARPDPSGLCWHRQSEYDRLRCGLPYDHEGEHDYLGKKL